jgi:predicted phosphoribosyltransferase
MSTYFTNRREAGELLADSLLDYAHRPDTLLLALPRGGVPVAFALASRLHLPLSLCLVRKLGVPQHRELAMGAIAFPDILILNQDLTEMSKEVPTYKF